MISEGASQDRRGAPAVGGDDEVRGASATEMDAARRLGQLVARAGHDLRQPIHALGLFAASLRQQPLAAPAAEIAARIEQTVANLSREFESVVAYLKAESGVLEVHEEIVALEPLLADVVGRHLDAAHGRGLHLRHVATRLAVRADAQLLERSLDELIATALETTTEGGVVLGCRPRAGQVWLEVWDSGNGLVAEQGARALEPFERGAGPRAGGGVGLALVRRLAGLMDGEFQLHGRSGRGTLARLMLPRAVVLAPPLPLSSGELEHLKVLLLEDDEMVRSALSGLLAGWGCSVLSGAASTEAVAAMRAHRFSPDLVLLDWRLAAGETALEAYGAVSSALGYALPGAVFSGELGSAERAQLELLELPALLKPVRPEVLLQLLQRLREEAL